MDLSTTARVKALAGVTGTGLDTLYGQLVTSYSQTFEAYLNRWAQATARTEISFVPRFRNLFSMRGAPISTVTSVKYNSSRDFTNATALTANTDYVLDTEQATIRLLIVPNLAPGYIEVQYTGGMAASQAAFTTAFPIISDMLDLQVLEHARRRDTPAGNVSVTAGGTSYLGELKMLESVREVLDQFKRHYVA